MRREIFGDELAGEAGGAIDDDVELRRRHIGFLVLVIASAAKQSILSRRGGMDCFASLAMTVSAAFRKPISSRTKHPYQRERRPGCRRARSDSANRSWQAAS